MSYYTRQHTLETYSTCVTKYNWHFC